jgi:hypothetical protein
MVLCVSLIRLISLLLLLLLLVVVVGAAAVVVEEEEDKPGPVCGDAHIHSPTETAQRANKDHVLAESNPKKETQNLPGFVKTLTITCGLMWNQDPH